MKRVGIWALASICVLFIAASLVALGFSMWRHYGICAAAPPAEACWRYAFAASADSIAYVVTALFSGVLVFYTVRLSQVANDQIQVARTQASIAADQTEQLKRTNDIAAAIERAYVFAKVKLRKGWAEDNATGMSKCVADVLFCNRGKTHAGIERIRGYASWTSTTIPSVLAEHANADHTLPQGLVIAAGDDFRVTFYPEIPSDVAEQIRARNVEFSIQGLIDYRDVHGQKQTTGYCWRYSEPMGNPEFVIAQGTPLNFHT